MQQDVAGKDRAAYLIGRFRAMGRHFSELLSVAGGTSRTQFPVDGLPTLTLTGEYAGFMRDALNRVTTASLDAARKYVPQYYPGKIVLFKASQRVVEPY